MMIIQTGGMNNNDYCLKGSETMCVYIITHYGRVLHVHVHVSYTRVLYMYILVLCVLFTVEPLIKDPP